MGACTHAGTRSTSTATWAKASGPYTMGVDADIIPHITSANIACGFHAGDPGWMRATVSLAERHRVGVGAHPGFPDLRGFGRRVMQATPAEITDDLVYQIGALTAFTGGKRLQHVKPHGALYNMAVEREDVARAIGDAILAVDRGLILVVLAGSPWEHGGAPDGAARGARGVRRPRRSTRVARWCRGPCLAPSSTTRRPSSSGASGWSSSAG